METTNGQELGQPVKHDLEIKEIGLNNTRGMQGKLLTFIDVSHHLYIVPVERRISIKLSNMVDSALWHPSTDMLATVADQKPVTQLLFRGKKLSF